MTLLSSTFNNISDEQLLRVISYLQSVGMSGFEVRTISNRYIDLRKILVNCCRIFNVSVDRIAEKRRVRELVYARYAYVTIARSILPKYTLRQIGERVGLDHAAVLHAIKVSKVLLEVRDPFYTLRFNEILLRLGVMREMIFLNK